MGQSNRRPIAPAPPSSGPKLARLSPRETEASKASKRAAYRADFGTSACFICFACEERWPKCECHYACVIRRSHHYPTQPDDLLPTCRGCYNQLRIGSHMITIDDWTKVLRARRLNHQLRCHGLSAGRLVLQPGVEIEGAVAYWYRGKAAMLKPVELTPLYRQLFLTHGFIPN